MKNKSIPEIRFSGFSGEWEERKLENLGNLSRGRSKHRPRNDAKLFGGKYPFIQTGDVAKAGLFLSNYQQTYSDFGIQQSKLWSKGTLLITIAANIAETSILNIEAAFPDSVIGFESSLVNTIFIKNVIDNASNTLKNKAETSSQANLNLAKLSELKIMVPTLNEQREIGTFFKMLDGVIDIRQQELTTLKQTRHGLIQKILSREIRFKNEENEFPSWKSVTLREILFEINEKTTSNNEEQILSSTTTGLFRQKDYFKGDISSIDNTGYKILRKGQVVFSPQNLWMGNINYNNLFDIGIVSPSYKVFQINKEFNKELIGFILKTPRMLYEYMISSEQGASVVRRNLDMNMFYSIKIKVPTSQREQQEIADFFEQLDDTIALHEQELDTLKQTKKAFLQKMFV